MGDIGVFMNNTVKEPLKREPRGEQAIKIRFPPEVHQWLKETAEKNDRSMTYLVLRAVKMMKQQMEI